MVKNALESLLKRAKRHVASQERYRYYPLYSILFPALLHVAIRWPYDSGIFQAWVSHPWIIVLDRCTWNMGVWMGVCFGAVGLLRNGWIPRLTSAVGLWCSLDIAFWYLPRLTGSKIMGVVFDVFDFVRDWVLLVSGEQPSAEATVWACLLFVLWLVMRTPVKIAFRHVFRLQEYAIRRWPALSKLARPVL